MTSEPPARIEQIRSLCRAGKVAAGYQQARALLAEARARGEDEAIAEALIALAHVHFRLGQYDRAQALLAEAISRTLQDHPLQVEALIHLGLCAAETNAPDEAEAYYRRAVDLSRLLGYEEALYRGLHALAVGVYIPRGQFELALVMDRDAYDFIVAQGRPALGWTALAAMGWVYWLIGRPHEAAGMAARLREVAPAGSLPRGFHDALLADLAQDQGRMEEAARLYARARDIATRIGDPGLQVLTYLGSSRLMRRVERWAAARSWADEALAVARRVGYVHLEGMALLARARASFAAGDLPPCEADLHQAIDLMTPLRFDFHLAEAWLLLAGLLQRMGRDEREAWNETVARIQHGRFYFLLERERAIAFPLLARQTRSSHAAAKQDARALLRRLAATPATPLRIHTLGRFEVWQGPRRIEDRAWRKRRAGELFRILLIAPHRTRTQEQLAEALWPDRALDAAQPLLHQATSALRRALEPDLPRQFPSRYLEVAGDCITLRLPPGSWVAHEVFADLVRQARYEEALALYHGPLFAQYPYADWAVWERERLAQAYLRALMGAGEAALARRDPQRALTLARQALALEPWQEQATRLGMEACLALGDRAAALRLYRALAERLQTDLGVEPGEDLRAFYGEIVGG